MKNILLTVTIILMFVINTNGQKAAIDVYRDATSTNNLTMSWANGFVTTPASTSSVGVPYEGANNFLFDFKLGTAAYWAGGEIAYNNWWYYDLTGYTHMNLSFKSLGLKPGTQLMFTLKDSLGNLSPAVEIGNGTTPDGIKSIPLTQFIHVDSSYNPGASKFIDFAIQAAWNSDATQAGADTGQVFIDAFQFFDYSVPTISSLSALSGAIGDVITVNGTNFNYVTTVKIGNVVAVVSNLTSTSFDITVPAGAVAGKIKITNPGGTTQSASNFNIVAGINDKNNSISFSVGPNPSAGVYTINSEEQIDQVVISDRLGNIISNNSNLSVDLTNQPEGIYFLKVVSGDKSDVRKLLKNK